MCFKNVKQYASIPAFTRTHTKQPTDAELQTAYTQGLADNCSSRRYVSQILVATQAEAQAIETQLAGGADFATLASQKSTDTQTASSGGAYGCLERLQTAPTFADAATATPIGTTSAPVQLADGWHVIRVQDVGDVVSFEKAKPQIIDQLRTNDGKTQLAKLVGKAKVKIAPRYGKWVVTAGSASVVPPSSSTTTTTTKPAGSSTTTTKP